MNFICTIRVNFFSTKNEYALFLSVITVISTFHLATGFLFKLNSYFGIGLVLYREKTNNIIKPIF